MSGSIVLGKLETTAIADQPTEVLSGFKVYGMRELQTLLRRDDTWKVPESLDDFCVLIKKAISTSRYRDDYKKMPLRNLLNFVRAETRKFGLHGDVEECVTVAAVAYLLYDKLTDMHTAAKK